MGVAVFSEIEQLVDEQGPAPQLKEGVARMAEQYAALQRQLREAHRRVEQLGAEKHRLVLENLQLTDTVRQLEEQLAQRERGREEAARRSILLLLAQHSGLTAEQIAQAVDDDRELACFHLEALETDHFVFGHYAYLRPTTWHLSQEGRRYLVIQDLFG